MSMEMPKVETTDENEKVRKMETRIQEIRDAIERDGNTKELESEFITLWKAIPNNVSDQTHDNIDEIQVLLMKGYKKVE